jgi:hypothetical protein
MAPSDSEQGDAQRVDHGISGARCVLPNGAIAAAFR